MAASRPGPGDAAPRRVPSPAGGGLAMPFRPGVSSRAARPALWVSAMTDRPIASAPSGAQAARSRADASSWAVGSTPLAPAPRPGVRSWPGSALRGRAPFATATGANVAAGGAVVDVATQAPSAIEQQRRTEIRSATMAGSSRFGVPPCLKADAVKLQAAAQASDINDARILVVDRRSAAGSSKHILL